MHHPFDHYIFFHNHSISLNNFPHHKNKASAKRYEKRYELFAVMKSEVQWGHVKPTTLLFGGSAH